MRKGREGERGFTMVEMLIVAVLGSLIVAAAYEMLRTNQRAFTIQTAQVQSQQSVRAGLDVLTSELRELSRTGEDLIALGPDSMTVRAMRAFGLLCDINSTGSPIIVKKVGRYFSLKDSIFAFVDNDPDKSADDSIYVAQITGIDTTSTCPTGGDSAQTISSSGLTAIHTAGDTMRDGGPMRAFTRFTYGIVSSNSEYYLGRKNASGTTSILVGPVASGGVSFTYYDSIGGTTTTPALVYSIGVTLKTLTKVVDEQGNLIADSLTTRIHLRN
jgi:prepilin-type N-terminal cleavage/methylation domain-containing protein